MSLHCSVERIAGNVHIALYRSGKDIFEPDIHKDRNLLEYLTPGVMIREVMRCPSVFPNAHKS